MEIYSKIDPELLLHILVRKQDMNDERQDLVEEDQFLQVAALNLPAQKTFKPHYHLWKDHPNEDTIAQESWVVIYGNVEVTYYDIDGTVIHKDIIGAGDCSITLYGGHNYYAMEKSLVYEFKTGPYLKDKDKEFI